MLHIPLPNVKGKTVNQAKRAITRAGCWPSVMGRRYGAQPVRPPFTG